MEIEAKLLAKDVEVFEQISNLDSILEFSLQIEGEFVQRDTYYDTGNYDLIRSGAIYRIREKEGDERLTVTFKREVRQERGIHEREEIEAEIEKEEKGEAEKGEMDLEPIHRLKATIGNSKLLKTLQIENHRKVINLLKEKEVHLKLCLDAVNFIAKKNVKEDIEMIEIEKEKGTKEDIIRIGGFLKGKFNLTSSTKSKYALGLEKIGKERSIEETKRR